MKSGRPLYTMKDGFGAAIRCPGTWLRELAVSEADDGDDVELVSRGR